MLGRAAWSDAQRDGPGTCPCLQACPGRVGPSLALMRRVNSKIAQHESGGGVVHQQVPGGAAFQGSGFKDQGAGVTLLVN